jgi:hypothetical protein
MSFFPLDPASQAEFGPGRTNAASKYSLTIAAAMRGRSFQFSQNRPGRKGDAIAEFR